MASLEMEKIINRLTANNSGLSGGWREFLASGRPVIIYGAGRQASLTYNFCSKVKKQCFCLLTTAKANRWGMLPEEDVLPLFTLESFPHDSKKADYDVIIALNPKYNYEVQSALASAGFPHVYKSNNWEADNQVTRDIFYLNYFLESGAYFEKGIDDINILCYDSPSGTFKIYYDIDEIYKSVLLGDADNIILPSIFNDFSLINAFGPYEYKNVHLNHGDIVLDCGACIGEFSCVAAARGCEAHAFEPTPATFVKYLSLNASLYKSIYINQHALTDKNELIDFYVNDSFAESVNITRNSILSYLEPSYTRISVNSMTIDAYFNKNKIPGLDFIKSHTEYSEPLLIKGGRETIQKFTPKAAMLESGAATPLINLLREINPQYRMVEPWPHKIFAWLAE